MNFSHAQFLSRWLSSLFNVTAFVAALTALTACTALSGMGGSHASPLPIKTVDAAGGRIVRTQAFETSDRLYVAGSMRRHVSHHLPAKAHVDVRLIDRGGNALAGEQDDIDMPSQTQAARGRGISFVVSFPLGIARQAESIHVSYHLETHPEAEPSHGAQP